MNAAFAQHASASRGPLGAVETATGARFTVWAPRARSVEVVVPGGTQARLERGERGYWAGTIDGIGRGARYLYRLDGERDRPDPASRLQPDGVHGASVIVALDEPRRTWDSPALRDYVMYELHVGTFSPEGTFDGVVRQLDRLVRLGVTAVEIMPVAQFPGSRNWGYDGVFPFAAHSAYGGPAGLRRLARACHERGLALVLDVVYNHLGPEGNYLAEFAPYFTDCYDTPWGLAINFDGPGSDDVRRYFLENALYWLRDCEVDSLRLDAVHSIWDRSAYPFLQELADTVHAVAAETGRNIYLIAESDLNDPRLIRPAREGGYGLDAQWADDLHHCIHTLLTGERRGYYGDFGTVEHLASALRDGWVYSDRYSPVRDRRYGVPADGIRPEQFVVCSQNHDQVGNRMNGERLVHLVGPEKAGLAAAVVLLSPATPMLFMGEEYAEPAPFLYHVSHTDQDLQRMVREGRREEFAAFQEGVEPPDPQDEATFLRSKLNPDVAAEGPHAAMLALYSELIRLRNAHPAIKASKWGDVRASGNVVEVARCAEGCSVRLVFNFGDERALLDAGKDWSLALATSAPSSSRADGDAVAPWSCAVLTRCSHG